MEVSGTTTVELVNKITDGVQEAASAGGIAGGVKGGGGASGESVALALAGPGVVKVIDQFWRAVLLLRRDRLASEAEAEPEPGPEPEPDDDSTATIGEYEYVFLHLRIQKAMLPDFDAAEAMELSTHEMATDLQRTASLPLRIPGGGEPAAGGQARRSSAELLAANELDYTALFASVYEIAHEWVTTPDADTYERFLRLLFARITDSSGRLLAELDDVTYYIGIDAEFEEVP